MYGEDRDYNIDEVLEEITFFKGTGYFINEFCSSPESHCPTTNYKEISEAVSLNNYMYIKKKLRSLYIRK